MATLLEQLEEARANWTLTDKDLNEFNKSWALKIQTSLNTEDDVKNVHFEELNKTGKNYKDIVDKKADALSDVTFDTAEKQTDIEKAKNAIKTERSDDTREELLDVTDDFKDKQDDRYDEVEDITKRQENIANRQANMAAANAWKYGDIYSDGGLANIKNDIIKTYGQNILNAEQYALNTNRTIDNDLLNVWLKEIEDKDKRDAFKDALLDKENAYMLNAISVAAEGDKQAIKDVANFYESFIQKKASDEATRAWFTELRAGMESEYDSVDAFWKANIVRDMSADLPGYSIVADRIPSLINKYPNATLSEIQGKVAKIAELALTAKQQLPTIIAKEEKDRTQVEKDLLEQYGTRWLEEAQASDRQTSETIAQQKASEKWEIKEGPVIQDRDEAWKEVLRKNTEDVAKSNEEKRQRIADLKLEKERKEAAALREKINENKRKRKTAYEKLADMAREKWFADDRWRITRLKAGIDKAYPITF